MAVLQERKLAYERCATTWETRQMKARELPKSHHVLSQAIATEASLMDKIAEKLKCYEWQTRSQGWALDYQKELWSHRIKSTLELNNICDEEDEPNRRQRGDELERERQALENKRIQAARELIWREEVAEAERKFMEMFDAERERGETEEAMRQNQAAAEAQRQQQEALEAQRQRDEAVGAQRKREEAMRQQQLAAEAQRKRN